MTTRVLYLRCMDGHWFREHSAGWACPIDGWFFGRLEGEVREALRDLNASGVGLTTDGLQELGVPPAAIDQCMIVEFGPGIEPPLLLEPTPI